MGQVLRVTVGASDHNFKLINVNPSVIEVELNGETLQLNKQGLSWVTNTNSNLPPQLAEAIGKAVALRYRI